MYIILIVVVIIVVVLLAKTTIDTDDYIYGFWAAEGDQFCEDSGINSMMLFIGDGSRRWFTFRRQGYIVITDGFSSQGLTFEHRYALVSPLDDKLYTTAKVTFDDEQIWPENVDVVVDKSAGTLTISADGTVYAKLYKHHDITNAAKCFTVEDAADSE
jgi:hypothetical protein